MYRAQEWEGVEGQYALENVDMADLNGVMQYIHREIITEHQIGNVDKITGKPREARKYDISHILQFRFLIKNPATQSNQQQDFHGYETYDFGQASNKANWNDLAVADHVGVQRQSNKFVPFQDPYFWFSLSGFCPNLPFSRAAITANCPEDLTTRSGTCASKLEALPRGCSQGSSDMSACLCYRGGNSVVWGGLCGADQDRKPPSEISIPTGQPGCTYSYDRHPKTINIDELTGITQVDCGGRKCKDYSDFRLNCANPKYKQYFSPLGSAKKSDFCVEYDLHPDCAQLGCDHPTCKRMNANKREMGLPFWKGRCIPQRNTGRAESALKLFGVEDADTTHKVTVPPTGEYASRPCDTNKNLECRANVRNGENYCTRQWSGVCTSCRLAGFKNPPLNRKSPYCAWDVLKDYPKSKPFSCKSNKADELCCLYHNSCAPAGDDLSDASFATVLFSKNTDEVKAFVVRVAKELLGVKPGQITKKAAKLDRLSYWAWGHGPSKKYLEVDRVTLKSLTDELNKVFPGSTVYTTTTTTTTTTTRTRRTFAPLTTRSKASTTVGDLPFECLCDVEGVIRGVATMRAGCAAHITRKFGNFCYIEGDRKCAGAKYSGKLKLWYRKCNPDLEMGAP